MKVKLNSTNNDLWCTYWKEKIEIGERYIEVIEDYCGEEIIKTYSYECLDMLIDEHLENYDVEPNIEIEDYE
jgi:hypothetical protein